MKKVLLVLMLISATARAETYQWTDQAGTVHFSDSLASVPSTYRKSTPPAGMDAREGTTGTKRVSSAEAGPGSDAGGAVPSQAPQVEGLKERMMNDEGIMKLITALQSDPELQAILGDPAIMNAIQRGDLGTLIQSPVFLKLLDNPRVKEIEKTMQGGTK